MQPIVKLSVRDLEGGRAPRAWTVYDYSVSVLNLMPSLLIVITEGPSDGLIGCSADVCACPKARGCGLVQRAWEALPTREKQDADSLPTA